MRARVVGIKVNILLIMALQSTQVPHKSVPHSDQDQKPEEPAKLLVQQSDC